MSSVRQALQGKNLLLTGVTGFVGKVLVAFLLEHLSGPDGVGRITLLSRGKRGRDARERIVQLFERSPAFRPLRERHGENLAAWLEARVEVVDGDAREPFLGIGQGELATLAKQIDAVVHVAGLTDFAPDPLDALAVNVHGALGAANVAAMCRGRRLLHVSTCFVAGGIDGTAPEKVALEDAHGALSPNGTRFRPEEELLSIESLCRSLSERHPDVADARRARIDAGTLRARALGWPNLYTYSKALAELLLVSRHRRDRHPLRVSIVRPAIVECARTFPFPGWNEGVNTAAPLIWLTGTVHRRMPFRAENVFDVIPVDEVVKGMVISLASLFGERDVPNEDVDVFQLATGDHNPLTLGRALDLTALTRRRQYARSSDPFERIVLQHLDSVIHDVPPETDPVLPALKTATRTARDLLVRFDASHFLPKSLDERFGARLNSMAQKAGKELGQASRTVGLVTEMLRAFQPFVLDHDPHFATDRMRTLSAGLSEEERPIFGLTTETIDWRDYWMNVEIPGLDRWSLPLLRGERAPEDEPQRLTQPLLLVAPSAVDELPENLAYAGDAE